MKPESELSKDFSLILNRISNVDGHEKIENSMCNGTPDYTYTIDGIHGFIEFKCCPMPKKDNTFINLKHWTEPQRQWMRNRFRSNTVFLIVRCGDYDFIFDTKIMFEVEKIPFGNLKNYAFNVSFKNKNYWKEVNLIILSNKLKGFNLI